ncbi:MAG: ABC transporter ATP-binding protein [Myxococcota bacterium]
MNDAAMNPPGGDAVPPRTPTGALEDLSLMGSGGRHDRMGFKLVLGLLWRCVHLLRPVRKHLGALLGGFSLLSLALFPVVVIGGDVFWTRALLGDPLTAEEAWLLGWDPAQTVAVAKLSESVRRELVEQVLWIAVVLTIALTPVFLGLLYYGMWILQRVNQLLRVQLMERLQSLSLRFHAENKVGDALYRIYQDSAMVTQLIEVLFITPLLSFGRFFFSLAVVSAYDPQLAGLLLLIWPPALLIGAFVSKRLRVRFRDSREANSRLTSRIQETLTGIRVIKAYGIETAEQERFEWSSREAFRTAFRARSWLASFHVVIFWVLGTATLTAIAIATLQTRDAVPLAVAAAGFTAWNLGLYNVFKGQLGNGTEALRDLFGTWGRVQDIAIGLDRAFEVLDLEPEVQDADDAILLPPFKDRVTFRDVHFQYQEGHPVLAGVDLEAEIGSITAIVGTTGSGKSTLLSLLLRLFDPDRGAIEIDGRDLRGIQLESLRASVSIALQENLLFGETVLENIRFAVPGASREAVEAAAHVACADEFIRGLSEGYDTLLGERGTKLSTGQRQRLSIARAILKDTPILILDEPSASLDAQTELQLMENLTAWGRGRAIFLITHRLSTIRRSDSIAVLADGRILEHGSHDELIAREGGRYRALADAHGALSAATAS